MKKMLLVLAIVGLFITTSASSFVYAETQQDRIGNNNSALPLPSPGVNYTIYHPPYDGVNGWGEYWAGNIATGYIGCAVNGSGESAALQQLKINVGRVKTLTIDATIKYVAGGNEGSGSSGEDEQYILADFTYSPSNPEVNEIVNFYDASDGNIVSWQWNFGDEATSSQQNPSHSYSQEGTYCVSLTVTDNNGNSSGIMKFVSVSENNGNQGSGQQGSGGGQNS